MRLFLWDPVLKSEVLNFANFKIIYEFEYLLLQISFYYKKQQYENKKPSQHK
ncbi:hypothetical protein GILI108418_14660 [Gillisia limnaea]